MSDTPKTDELAKREFVADGVWIRHARELERENADLHDTLDAVISADERAVELWRAAHPGKELVIPDRTKLVGWLLEQNAALRDSIDHAETLLCNSLPMAHCKQSDWDNVIRKWRDQKHAIDAARKEAQP